MNGEVFADYIQSWSEAYGSDNAVFHLIDIMVDNLSDEQLSIIASELWQYEDYI